MKDKQNIIVVGCGRLGSYLATQLSVQGHRVVAIDHSKSALERLPNEFSGFQIKGDAVETLVLKQAKIETANGLIATTSNDNVNLMVAQIAQRIYQVPRVIARVYDPRREELYNALDIHTICTTTLASELFLKELREDGRAK